jgi:hypothetical protein
MSHWKVSAMSVAFAFSTLSCGTDRDAGPQALDDFNLDMTLEGVMAFVPDKEVSPAKIWTLLVNTDSEEVAGQPLSKHVSALRVRVNHLFPADQVEVPDSFVVVPLKGELSFPSCVTSGNLNLINRQWVPKLKELVPDYGKACADCTGAPDKVPAKWVVSRLSLDGGDIEFTKEIMHPNGGRASWCFDDLNPQKKCKDAAKVRVIAQRARTKLKCSGNFVEVEVLPFGVSQVPRKFKLYPRMGSVGVEILNVVPEDIPELDLDHGQYTSNLLRHFLWFYTLAGKTVDPGKARTPAMEDPVLGGKPYCSFAELEK